MRKLPQKYEDIIDNIIYKLVPTMSNILDPLTPNTITFISLIFGLISVNKIYNDYYYQAILFYMLSYLFDCIDGYHARRKKLVSKFGDYFDHISDILIFVLMAWVILKKIGNDRNIYLIISLTIINIMLMSVHFTLQECYYGKESSKFLNIMNLKIKNPEKYLIYSRYFGSGCFNIYIIMIILYLSIDVSIDLSFNKI